MSWLGSVGRTSAVPLWPVLGVPRGFSCPIALSHLWTALHYVESNSIRAGLVQQPVDYEWSTAEAHLSGHDRRRVLDMDFFRRSRGVYNSRLLFGTSVKEADCRAIRKATFARQPFGDELFWGEHPRQPAGPKGARGTPAGLQQQAGACLGGRLKHVHHTRLAPDRGRKTDTNGLDHDRTIAGGPSQAVPNTQKNLDAFTRQKPPLRESGAPLRRPRYRLHAPAIPPRSLRWPCASIRPPSGFG